MKSKLVFDEITYLINSKKFSFCAQPPKCAQKGAKLPKKSKKIEEEKLHLLVPHIICIVGIPRKCQLAHRKGFKC